MPKLNICVVGLAKNLTDKVCTELASQLELYYANVEKILEFELFDKDSIEKICGRDFLLKEEKAIIKRLSTYENTLINLNYFSVNNEEILKLIKERCLLIYLSLDYRNFREVNKTVKDNSNILDITLFEDRDAICKEVADVVVMCDDTNPINVSTNVINEILKYYS